MTITSGKAPLTGEEITQALVALGVDPDAGRIGALQATIDAATLPVSGRDAAVRLLVEAATYHRTLVVDGTDDAGNFAGDGMKAPFVVFDVDAQANISGPFATREKAEEDRVALLKGETKPYLNVAALRAYEPDGLTLKFSSSASDGLREVEVEVIRPLTEEEADLFDIGPMFRIRLPDGTIQDAFADELSLTEAPLSTPVIRTSVGATVPGSLHVAGGGVPGAPDLGGAVDLAAELLCARYAVDVEKRYNSNGRSGGAFLVTEPDGQGVVGSNGSIGISVRTRGDGSLDVNVMVAQAYLRDTALATCGGAGPVGRYAYPQADSVSAAVDWLDANTTLVPSLAQAQPVNASAAPDMA